MKPLRIRRAEKSSTGVDVFYESDEETRASDCADRFVALHQCMVKHSEEFKVAEELAKHKRRRSSASALCSYAGGSF